MKRIHLFVRFLSDILGSHKSWLEAHQGGEAWQSRRAVNSRKWKSSKAWSDFLCFPKTPSLPLSHVGINTRFWTY